MVGVLECPPVKLRRGDGAILLAEKRVLVFGNKFAMEMETREDGLEVEKTYTNGFNFNGLNLVPYKQFSNQVYALGGNDFGKVFRYTQGGVWERV